MIPARQSTALELAIGPVLDADGVAVTDCVVADFKIKKTTGNFAALNGSATLAHVSAGMYDLVLTTSDVDTVGLATIAIDDTVNACAPVYLQVIEEAVYDRDYAAAATGIVGTAQTGDSFARIGATGSGLTSLASQASLDTLDNILDTEFPALVTAVDALPTNAELATALGTADDAVLAAIATVQADLDIITGAAGVVIADDSLTAAKFADDCFVAANFATGAFTADVFAADALVAATFAADVATEFQSGLATSAALASLVTTVGVAGAGLTAAGGDGSQLTAINLPNQTMDITGNITGNVSGSVGSVTGAVGSVTGAVGSVTGLTAADVAAIKVITDALGATAAARLALSAGQIIPFTVDDTVAPTTTEFEAADIVEATGDHFNGRIIIFTTGALAGQATSISDYALAGGKGHFTTVALTEAPADGDTGIIV